MLKQRKNKVLFAAGVGLCALLISVPLLASKSGNWLGKSTSQSQSQERLLSANPKSAVPLVSLSPEQRKIQLQAIAQLPQSPERNRARYLLAIDLIQQNLGEEALSKLEGLEQDYPVLAPQIALKRAQAYDLTGDTKAATAYLDLLKRYPDNSVAAEALFMLGRTEPKYWQQAIAQFPSHPRTLEITRSLLKQNPNQPQLLLLLAQYTYAEPGITSRLDQLVSQYPAQLKPEEWEIIGSAYWKNKVYAKAGAAYAKAPRTPLSIYRTGRGFQLGEKRSQALAAYQQLVRDYPNAKETGIALMHLAKMAQKPQEALMYLDWVISRVPNQAGAALVEKAEILDSLQSKKSAAKARQLLLSQYGSSDAAAEYRWKVALVLAAAKDYQGAWQWAQPIPTNNPDSILAPRAGFWIGKWATQLGRQGDAKAAFEYVLGQFPQSYYAWRSAAMLGLNVGNFKTLRQLNPEVVMPARAVLPAGSDTLKELYQLGQDRDAWMVWQVEFQNSTQPTVAEQFTDGLMRLSRGENLLGISRIETLEDRETPQEQAEYHAFSRQMAYWQARYPFPFLKEIEAWSQQRQINPLLVTALIRQESRFEPNIRSIAGAAGLMQVMPGTGKWIAGKMNLKQYNLDTPNDNVKLGTWFFDYTHQQYKNNSLLAVASYNAGPGNVSKWLKQLNKNDPDEFVEAIPFDETRGYVRQVFGNYWNYLRLYNPEISQLVARYSNNHPKALPQ